MKRRLIIIPAMCGFALFATSILEAWAQTESGNAEAAGHGLDPLVLAGVAVILIVAKLSGELFERFKQPAVLGELLGGIFIGNLALFGIEAIEPLKKP